MNNTDLKKIDRSYFIERENGYRLRLKNLDDSIWNSFKIDIPKFKKVRFDLASKYGELMKLTHDNEIAMNQILEMLNMTDKKYFQIDEIGSFKLDIKFTA